VSAAVVPGATTVCSSSAVRVAATNLSPMRGACVVAIAVSVRRPAVRMPLGPPQRDRISGTAGWLILGPMARSSAGWMPVSRLRMRSPMRGGFAGQVVVELDQDIQFGQGVLADVQAEEHPETAGHLSCRSFVAGGRTHIATRPTQWVAVSLMSGPSTPTRPGDTPGSCVLGALIMPNLATTTPLIRSYELGNGVRSGSGWAGVNQE